MGTLLFMIGIILWVLRMVGVVETSGVIIALCISSGMIVSMIRKLIISFVEEVDIKKPERKQQFDRKTR